MSIDLTQKTVKNSKKNFWMSIVGIALSLTIFGATAFAATDNVAGYNKFKELIIDSAVVAESDIVDSENATITSLLTVKKDQVEIATVSNVSKNHMEGENFFSSSRTTIRSEQGEVTEDSWTEAGLTENVYVTKSSTSDRYNAYVMTFADMGLDFESAAALEEISMSPAQERLMNAMIDLIAGDTKSQFRTEGDKISVRLEGAQIPELGQLVLNVLEEEMQKENSYVNHMETSAAHFMMSDAMGLLELKDLRLEVIDVELEFADRQLKNLAVTINISGLDANGVKHIVEIDGSITVSDAGTTTADKINLEDIKDQVDVDETSNYTQVMIDSAIGDFASEKIIINGDEIDIMN